MMPEACAVHAVRPRGSTLRASRAPPSTTVRHTRGTELIAPRSPLHVVQKTLGHVDPRSTQVYVELAEDQLRHELERHRR